MSPLKKYISRLLGQARISGEHIDVFAKVLTDNDDSGRHGVVVPVDVYEFLPTLAIRNPDQNETLHLRSFDLRRSVSVQLSYKYYQRYPERRLTCLDPDLNDRVRAPRLLIVLRIRASAGTSYAHLASFEKEAAKLWALIAGPDVPLKEGAFVLAPIDAPAFSADDALQELLDKFDRVAGTWVLSKRSGDTGIGFTFETLMGIQENNDRRADFRGIEIKCTTKKETKSSPQRKLNLFQQGPEWIDAMSQFERLRRLGRSGAEGLACHSQLTTVANNLGLFLEVDGTRGRIVLRKNAELFGYWPNGRLKERLFEKHSRAVFVKAERRESGGQVFFKYDQLVYCERPDIERFLALVRSHQLVFEFLMREGPVGKVRNHGYPWRLTREEALEHLFELKLSLR